MDQDDPMGVIYTMCKPCLVSAHDVLVAVLVVIVALAAVATILMR